MKARSRHSLIVLILIVITATSTLCQENSKLAFLSPVEVSQRARLAERLADLVKYETTHNWGKLYGLLYKVNLPEYKSRKNFIKSEENNLKTNNWVVLDFVPTHTQEVNSGNWFLVGREKLPKYIIYGCGEFRVEGKIKQWKAAVFATLENNDWFFSRLAVVGQDVLKDKVDDSKDRHEPCSK